MLNVTSPKNNTFYLGVKLENESEFKYKDETYIINFNSIEKEKEENVESQNNSISLQPHFSHDANKLSHYFGTETFSSHHNINRQESLLKMAPKQEDIQVTSKEFMKVLKMIKDDQTNKTHLVFYYASPLKPPQTSKSKSELPRLNFTSEYNGIQKALRNTEKWVKYKKKVATAASIAEMIEENPSVLHFSGHGAKVHSDLKCNSDFVGGGNGDYLVIEDKFWGGQELNQRNLKNLLETTEIKIEIAVVLSCHSEYIGQIFLKAGIQHVICVGREYKIDDGACIAFAGCFYSRLFSGDGSTICNAFEMAKANVKTQYGKGLFAGEEHKFRCLHEHGKNPWKSNCLTIKTGNPIDCSVKPSIKQLPAREKQLIGRANCCWEIMKHLEDYRMIWLEGDTGIGKSAIAREIAWLWHERSVFEDGVLYISASSFKNFESWVENLYYNIKEGLVNKKDRKELEGLVNSDTSEKYKKSLSVIKDMKILLIFDNWDLIVETESNLLKQFLEDIMIKVEDCKILLTSVTPFVDFITHGGFTYKIDKLTNKQTFELLCSKVESKKQLMDEIFILQDEMAAKNSNTQPGAVRELDYDNNFFKLLNGHPHSVLQIFSLKKGNL